VDALATLRCPVGAVAQVILDITTPKQLFSIVVGKLLKDVSWVLTKDIREHIKASSMRHRENDFLDAVAAGLVNRKVEQRNQALASFERGALCADELLTDEFFKDDSVG